MARASLQVARELAGERLDRVLATVPEIGSRALAARMLAEGEVLQLMNSGDANVDEHRYLDVIRRKTAKLFEASTRLGAVLAGATPDSARLAAAGGRRPDSRRGRQRFRTLSRALCQPVCDR